MIYKITQLVTGEIIEFISAETELQAIEYMNNEPNLDLMLVVDTEIVGVELVE